MIPVNGPSLAASAACRGDTPAAPRTTASCVPSCGLHQTPARPRGCSFPRHDTPAGPARTSPPDTSPRLPVRATLTEGYTRSHFGPPQPDRPAASVGDYCAAVLSRGRERKKERYRQPEKAQGPPIRATVRSHVSRSLIPNCSRVAAVAFQNLAQVGGMALEGTLSPCRNADKGSFSIIVNIDKCHQNRLRIKPVARN